MSTQCKKIGQNGKRCSANAMLGSDYCFRHNPETQEQAKVASANGGASNRKVFEKLPKITVKNTKEVASLLEKVINELRDQKLEIRVANSIGYLSGNLIKALETSDIEKRLEALEEKIDKNN